MFGKLAGEMHRRQADKDHLKIIVEAANDVIPVGDEEDNSISLEDLDAVISTDGDGVTDEEVAALDKVVGEIADSASSDITTMTKAEIEEHISNVPTPPLTDLNS